MEKYFDTPVNQLARELAAKLGGTIANNRDGELFEGYASINVPATGGKLPYSLSLSLRGWGAAHYKLTVSINPARLAVGISLSGIKFPEAGISIDRPRDKVIGDIMRRVVDNETSQAMLTEYGRRVDALTDRDATLAAEVNQLLADCSNCFMTKNFPLSSGAGSARIFNQGGIHFAANLYESGSMAFERIGEVPKHKARRILDILAEK